jgi:hypothetical protein
LAVGGPFTTIAAVRRAASVLLLAAVAAVLVLPSWSSLPAAIPPGRQAEAWPRDGSTVEYDLRTSFSAPDGSYRQETTARLLLAFDGTGWAGTCSGETLEVVDGAATRSRWSVDSGGQPASAPRGAHPRQQVVVALLDDGGIAEGCRQRGETVQVVRRHGDTLLGEELPETSGYQAVSVSWDVGTGLVEEWSRLVQGGSAAGRLVATDAPGR